MTDPARVPQGVRELQADAILERRAARRLVLSTKGLQALMEQGG